MLTRGDVNKLVARYANMGIQNTALRFKFNTLCSRFFAMRRQWDETLRKIEAGTYERHVFKAKLHERERGSDEDAPQPHAGAAKSSRDETTAGGTDLFEAYRSARAELRRGRRTGVSREKLDQTRREAARRDPGRSTAATRCGSASSSRAARRSSRRRR